ncbi:MAG: DinB family protein [Chitinophagaceae bacterium]
MNLETHSIIQNLQKVNSGAPWYGRAVYELLDEVDPAKAAIKPNQSGHSLLDLLYHMLTWAEFTLNRIEGKKEDLFAFDELDWRTIDLSQHTWEKGLASFKLTHEKIIKLLEKKEDAFLEEKVDYREYNFRFLLNGLIQHNIYHHGQIAYISKFLV